MSRRVWSPLAALLMIAVAVPGSAQVKDWPSERPPRPLAAREVRFPDYEIRTLDNGLRVVVVMHHEQPAVSLRLLIAAGSAYDPVDKPGVASLMASVLDQGTKTRSAQDIATAIDNLGGALGVGAGTDLSFVNAVSLKEDFGFALDLVSDVARNPAFALEEIERQRQQVLSGLQVTYEDPEYVAGIVFDRLVYGFHPYGRPSSGTPASIRAITRDDLVAFHDRHFAPNNAILAVVGDVTAEEAFAGVERALGAWPRRELNQPDFDDPPPPTRRVVVVDRPGAVQTEIRVGHLGVARKNRDYTALDLAIKILGGEGANRLHRVLRSERGLTYGASAEFETLQRSGDFVVETNTRSETTGEALRLIVDEFWRIRRERVSRAELEGAQAYLAGSFPLTIETPSAIALQVLNHMFYGLDLGDLEDFPERVNAVTPAQVQHVAETYLKPDRLAIVLVGDADTFVSQLKGAGFGEYERVALADLDLDAADLKRSSRSRAPAGRAAGAGAADPVAAASRGRQLVARAIEASGGLDRLRGVHTLRATARTSVSTPDGVQEAETVTSIRFPDSIRVEADLPVGTVIQVYAAGQAWLRDPGGVHDASDTVRDSLRASASRELVPLLLRVEAGELEARARPDAAAGDGRPGPEVDITGDGFEPVTLRFDPETGRVIGQQYSVQGPTGSRETLEMVFDDYRDVDGVQMPYSATIRRQGLTLMQRVVTAFELNPPLDPGLFTRPS